MRCGGLTHTCGETVDPDGHACRTPVRGVGKGLLASYVGVAVRFLFKVAT
jgi:hypothetical protein